MEPSGVLAVCDVPYTDSNDRERQIDFYLPQTRTLPLPPILVYVHGGAWRTGDRKDYENLARKLVAKGSFCVAVPGYRLTTRDKPVFHPAPVEDIASAVATVAKKGDELGYDDTNIYLCGHSCGAQITGLLTLVPKYIRQAEVQAALEKPNTLPLFERVRGVVAVEGIFDIPKMLVTFPSYNDFVEMAFGSRDRNASVIVDASPRCHPIPPSLAARKFPYLIIHSHDDELLDVSPSVEYHEYLVKGGIAAELDLSLHGKHFEVLDTGAFLERVIRFVQAMGTHSAP